MKKTNITISFESEKLDALNFYIGKKDVNLQEELADTLQKLYEKHVPQPTREYLEDKLQREQKITKPKPNKPKEVITYETD
ncbi:MAG: DUF6103 family protein [Clostridia bacterium]